MSVMLHTGKAEGREERREGGREGGGNTGSYSVTDSLSSTSLSHPCSFLPFRGPSRTPEATV